MAFFGPLIGYGASGLVFSHAGDKDQVIKLVYLPDRDPTHYEEFANQQQAKLFEELADLEETPVGLPKVYHYMEGTVGPWLEEEVTDQIADPEAQKIFDEEFTSGRKFGLWMMENVPHRQDNQYGSYESPNERIPEVWSLAPDPDVRMGWRTRDYQNYVPVEQQHYRDMSNWLLENGYLVRDVKQLRNLGYRDAGTPVWYDPNVVTWPLETKEDQEAFDVIFTGFSPESIQNEITSGQYVENRRNAEEVGIDWFPRSRFHHFSNKPVYYVAMNWLFSSPGSKNPLQPPLYPDPDYEVVSNDCSIHHSNHEYGSGSVTKVIKEGKWQQLGNLRSLHDHWPQGFAEPKALSPLHEEGELYLIT